MMIRATDAVKDMRKMAERSVDLVLTDPPYSAKVHANAMTNTRTAKGKGQKAAGRELGFGHLTPSLRAGLSAGFARVAKAWVLVFTDVEGAHDWRVQLESDGLEYVRTMCWVKPDSCPQLTGDRPGSGWEAIVVAHATRTRGRPMKKTWNGGGARGVYTYGLPKGEGEPRIHTTQKPLGLILHLLRDFSDPGDVVLDACAGGGTTGVACVRTGRGFLGFDIDGAMAAKGNERIEAELRDNTLRGERMKQGTLFPRYGYTKEELREAAEALGPYEW